MKFHRLNIRRKIWLSIILPTLIITFITGLLLFYYSRDVAREEAHHRLLEVTQKYVNKINGAINQLELAGRMMEGLVKGSMPVGEVMGNEGAMLAYKQELTAITDSLLHAMRPASLWMVFNPELAPGAHTVSFYDHNGDGYYTRSTQYRVTDKDLNSRHMKWWTKGVEQGEYWTLRYYWEDWDMELISYANAVYKDSLLLGVAGSDFGFNKLREHITSTQVYEQGYLVLLDTNLNLLIHPQYKGKKLSDITSEKRYNQFKHLLASHEEGVVNFKTNEEGKQMLSYSKLSNGWILGAVVPVKEVYAGSRRLSWLFAGIIVLAIGLGWLMASLLGKSLTRPVNNLMEGLRKAHQGNIDYRVAVDGSVEVRELARHFNQFMQSISNLMNELEVSEKQLLEARMKAEEAEKLKSVFLGNISHEFRTPLTSIQGVVQLIEEGSLSPEEHREHLQTVDKQVQHILRLLDDLLELSRLRMNDLQPNYRTFNLNRLLDELHRDYRGASAAVDFEMRPKVQDEYAWIVSDEQRLKRILQILLENAFKFTPEGMVTMGYTMHQEVIQFYVNDTGEGIPKDVQNKVFSQFFQGNMHYNRAHDGVGVGLAIARQITDNLKGKLWFYSTEGKGTTFYLEIPYTKSQRERVPAWLKRVFTN